MARSDLNNVLFSFKITSLEELKELLEEVCIIGGGSRLNSFDIKDEKCLIVYLDDECVEKRFYFDINKDKFVEAMINGRNRHGKRVNYVSEAEVISVNMTYEIKDEFDENWVSHILTFSAVIDEIKVGNITRFIKE